MDYGTARTATVQSHGTARVSSPKLPGQLGASRLVPGGKSRLWVREAVPLAEFKGASPPRPRWTCSVKSPLEEGGQSRKDDQ